MKLDGSNGLPAAEGGLDVSEEMVSKWEKAYSDGRLPDGYEYDGPVRSGRPKMFNGEMSTLTIRIPLAQKEALAREAANRGMSISGYARELLAIR